MNDEGAHPKNIDYLRNFCLGKRKGKYPGNYFGIRLLKNITMEQRAREIGTVSNFVHLAEEGEFNYRRGNFS